MDVPAGGRQRNHHRCRAHRRKQRVLDPAGEQIIHGADVGIVARAGDREVIQGLVKIVAVNFNRGGSRFHGAGQDRTVERVSPSRTAQLRGGCIVTMKSAAPIHDSDD